MRQWKILNGKTQKDFPIRVMWKFYESRLEYWKNIDKKGRNCEKLLKTDDKDDLVRS